MKTKFCVLGFCLLSVAVVSMADEPSDLVALRKSYEKEIKRVTQPVNATYLKALQQLKDNYTRGSKLEQALAVDAEMKKLSSDRIAEITTSKPTSGDAAKSDRVKSWIIGYTWVDTRDPSEPAEYAFKDGGAGMRLYKGQENPFTWTIDDEGVVTVDRCTFHFKSEKKGERAFPSELKKPSNPLERKEK